MYVKTESGEIIEFHDHHHPERDEISHDNYSELYEKLYSRVGARPVEGVPSWQLFAMRMNRDGEMCIATFDTVEQANLALKSFCRDCQSRDGWDAVEYKSGLSDDRSAYDSDLDNKVTITGMYIRTEGGETLKIYGVYRHVHEIEESMREYYTENYGRPYIKPVDGASSWQLLSARLDDNREEICIAIFDTLKKASDALDSLVGVYHESGGWDAIEYKEPLIDEAKPDHNTTEPNRNPYLSKFIGDLGLSVRASNCLKAAGILSIQRLVTKKEEDLLKHQNIGPTTLYEIKNQVAMVGLTLGMSYSDVYEDWYTDKEPKNDKVKRYLKKYHSTLLPKSIAALELSVRVSNCLEAANIKTVRELVTKTEKDLLESKNFGPALLNEIKAALNLEGLSLGMDLDDIDSDSDIAE